MARDDTINKANTLLKAAKKMMEERRELIAALQSQRQELTSKFREAVALVLVLPREVDEGLGDGEADPTEVAKQAQMIALAEKLANAG